MSPATLPFVVADVFSNVAYKGNPLAIVSTLSSPSPLTKSQQQHITRQFNLSETTFFSTPSLPRATYALRSFLPDGREVFGAGHNILGVWWYLASSGHLKLDQVKPRETKNAGRNEKIDEWEFWQELGGEVLPVKVLKQGEQFSVSIRQAPPKLHAFHPNIEALARTIGIEVADIGLSDTSIILKPQVISTSTTKHLHVPIKSIEALNRVQVQRERLLEQLALVDDHAYGLYLFARVPGEKNSFQARFFSPGMSGEDPATGSAAGPLSLYLHEHGQFDLIDEIGSITVLQGLKVGRSCLINVILTRTTAGERNVDFSGSGVVVSKGDVVVPDELLSF